MPRKRTTPLKDERFLFKTPDNKCVAIPACEIGAVWDGTEPGTMILERLDGFDPVIVLGSTANFIRTHAPHWDERRRKRQSRQQVVRHLTAVNGDPKTRL